MVEPIRVRWHGHSCFEVATDEVTVVTDPHDGKSLGIQQPKVRGDVVLVSHDHFDHAATRVVAKPESRTITAPDHVKVGNLKIRGVCFYNLNRFLYFFYHGMISAPLSGKGKHRNYRLITY